MQNFMLSHLKKKSVKKAPFFPKLARPRKLPVGSSGGNFFSVFANFRTLQDVSGKYFKVDWKEKN